MWLLQLPIAGAFAVTDWRQPSSSDWLWIIIISLTALSAMARPFGIPTTKFQRYLNVISTVALYKRLALTVALIFKHFKGSGYRLMTGCVLHVIVCG
ncbi:hypothetical protein CW748_15290 [Alteromonadales bacterium alter-6D02]|nr:hypothetical protein CW748_15290 [Alteromonadales bacterium alter-6D02]